MCAVLPAESPCAGKSGAVGHITICDDVVVLGKTMISKDIKEPGVYNASFPSEPAKEWARQVGRFRRIDALQARVKKLEGK